MLNSLNFEDGYDTKDDLAQDFGILSTTYLKYLFKAFIVWKMQMRL